jgi:serine/threonine protein kinase
VRYCERCRAAFQALRTCPRDRVATRGDISDPLLGHVLGDRYRILERIAAGGMGQVYRAAHSRIASLFAVKVLYGDIAHDAAMRNRFQREAEAASCLHSRHIVRVVDFGESADGLLYLAMEHLDGMSLTSVIARDGPLTARRTTSIGRQIAVGLAHAHERGIIHRDLKADNVMLVEEDDEPEVVKLLDFGVARMRNDARLTQIGQVIGTPPYMAPEQFTGADVDARADLYALGVILYEMLAGGPPFEAQSVIELADHHLQTPPPPIRDRNPNADVPSGLEALVHRLLAKSPADRYPSARAVLAVLRPPTRSAQMNLSSHTAPVETPVDPLAAERIRATIQVGAPTYNSGDHQGCYEIYKETAEELLTDVLQVESATAAAARLRTALLRAQAMRSPTYAAWEIRYAFDDILRASDAQLTYQSGDGMVGTELAVAEAIAAPHYAAEHLDLVGDYYLEFAKQLSARLRRNASNPAMRAWLDKAVDAGAKAGGGQRALASLSMALEALRRGLYPTLPTMPAVTSLAGCPLLEVFAHRIVQAISLGAPAYNAGDADACHRIYHTAADSIVLEIGGSEPCADVKRLLKAAIDEAEHLSAEHAAWALRRAFDHLLTAAVGEQPLRDTGGDD